MPDPERYSRNQRYAAVNPRLAGYQSMTSREIPVVALTRQPPGRP